jgi:hypothetical protein
MPTPRVLREIRRATRPHGVATADRLRLSPSQLQRCCAVGVLERPHPGVYVDPAVPRTPLKDLAIAVAAGGHLAAAWGRSAGALWRLLDDHPPAPEIVIPKRRWARIDGVVVHRSSALSPDMLGFREHIRCTNALVTVVDLGVVLSPLDVAEVLIRARQQRLFEPAAVASVLARLARPGRNGVTTTRQALDLIMIGDRPAESALELRFAIGPGAHGIPPYVYQHEVRVAGRKLFIDFAYPSVKLAIEVDGYEKRRSRASFDYDTERQNLLTLDGWLVIRFTWTRVIGDPAGVAADIVSALFMRGYGFAR